MLFLGGFIHDIEQDYDVVKYQIHSIDNLWVQLFCYEYWKNEDNEDIHGKSLRCDKLQILCTAGHFILSVTIV